MKIAIVGTGYVGLVSSCCFADTGHKVVGVDIREDIVEKLNRGECTIYEPGLDEILKQNLKQKRLQFTTDLKEGIADASVIFLALPTPQGDDGAADLSRVLEVSKNIARITNGPKVIVLKSTVPVGTAQRVQKIIDENSSNYRCEVVNNPEFLKEGSAVSDFMKPDRIVIGCQSEPAKKLMEKLYAPFVRNGHPIYFMSNASAELTKYAANCFLATKISFINELANFCEIVGADIEEVKKGFTSDYRINPSFFHAGIGYGGSCFPKDVKAMVKSAEEAGAAMRIVNSADDANTHQKLWPSRTLLKHYNNDLKGKTIAVWGLSFKPKTDDMREAPSVFNILEMLKAGAHIKAFDPVAMENSKKMLPETVEYVSNSEEVLEGAHALVIFTEWNVFRGADAKLLSEKLQDKIIVDGRNVLLPEQTKSLELTHYMVGRPR